MAGTGPLQGTIELLFKSEQVVTNGKQVDDTLKRIQTTSDKTGQAVEFSAKRATLAMAGLTTSFVSTFYAAKNLEDMQLNVAKAHRKVEEAEQRLVKVRQDSKSTLQDIADAQRDVNIANEGYKQILDKVQESQVMFVASLGTMAITTIPSAVSALKGLSSWHGITTAAAGAHSIANGVLTSSYAALVVAAAPWIAIALAVVAAYEALAHVIKWLNPEIDITIENLSGLNKLWAESEKTQKGVITSQQNYNIEVGKGVEVTNQYGIAIGPIPEQHDKLTESLDKSAKSMGNFVGMWKNLNEEAIKNSRITEQTIQAQKRLDDIFSRQNNSIAELIKKKERFDELDPFADGGSLTSRVSGVGGYVIVNGRAVPADVAAMGRGVFHKDAPPPVGTGPGLLAAMRQAGVPNKQTPSLSKGGRTVASGKSNKHGAPNRAREHQMWNRIFASAAGSQWISQQEVEEIARAAMMPYRNQPGNQNNREAGEAAAKASIQATIASRQAAYYNQYGGLEQLTSQSGTLGMSVGDIISTLNNPLTKNDIGGMVLYKQLSALAG